MKNAKTEPLRDWMGRIIDDEPLSDAELQADAEGVYIVRLGTQGVTCKKEFKPTN